jgi:hypothetical protein
VTVNEVPGNEPTLSDAPNNQNSGDHAAGDQISGNQSPGSESPAGHAASDPGVAAAPRSPASRESAGRAVLALFAAIAAWLVPGLGHLLLGRWGRALMFFCAVSGLVVSGYLLRGNVFPPHSGDPFGTLGFLADAGTGVFYYFSRFFEVAGPDVSRAAGDYGTRFIAAAGVVNVLAVLDTIEIATGRRS